MRLSLFLVAPSNAHSLHIRKTDKMIHLNNGNRVHSFYIPCYLPFFLVVVFFFFFLITGVFFFLVSGTKFFLFTPHNAFHISKIFIKSPFHVRTNPEQIGQYCRTLVKSLKNNTFNFQYMPNNPWLLRGIRIWYIYISTRKAHYEYKNSTI